jgi:hypothetical protein
MAGGDRSPADGSGRPRAIDACPYWHDAGAALCQADTRIRFIEGTALGKAEAQEAPMTPVWIYVDTRYHPGHPDHLKVFANPVAADSWFKENDPEGVAFEYEILE